MIYYGNVLESSSIGIGLFPIDYEIFVYFVQASKDQDNSVLFSIANNFVGHSFDIIRLYIN